MQACWGIILAGFFSDQYKYICRKYQEGKDIGQEIILFNILFIKMLLFYHGLAVSTLTFNKQKGELCFP